VEESAFTKNATQLFLSTISSSTVINTNLVLILE